MAPLLNTAFPNYLSVLGGRHKIRFDEITLIEGQRNYTLFKCIDATQILTSKSLSWYQKCLPPYLFRVHKSYFVNLTFIVAFDGETIQLANGQRVVVSRRRRSAVRRLVRLS